MVECQRKNKASVHRIAAIDRKHVHEWHQCYSTLKGQTRGVLKLQNGEHICRTLQYTHTHAHKHAHTHTNTYVYTHTHTHTCRMSNATVGLPLLTSEASLCTNTEGREDTRTAPPRNTRTTPRNMELHMTFTFLKK